MSIEDRPTRTSTDDAGLDNRLDLMDQAFYAGHRAVGQREVMQVGWLYRREVDLDGLERFRDKLNQGMMGRLIERSPLPFGRWRWVSAPKPAELDVATIARPRAELVTGSTSGHNYLLIPKPDPAGGSASFPSPTARPQSAWCCPTMSSTASVPPSQ